MSLNIFFKSCMVSAVLALCVACSSTAEKESTGELLDSSMITSKVKALFLRDSEVSVFDISVTTFKGIVRLYGTVESEEVRNRAGEIAASVGGVKSVQNDLAVE